ncbi:NAD(P)/FAD-dependent oxidoreductase [Marinicella sp. S1101]|uniref:FAD-dependent oxidoreductase n=1 Tax=Marinicella marina TaxID=2996016 RepID=UPI002260B1B1|nr:NAD(P)/FAD-dependent oxidoreductase [Marinicella marina]MCX7553103.1 NAD(P)/FAD-dependent oxidoreductase [Marinicella marina]MDJ1138835.1 NAD(P)/FAD-dependent oxidoreductase [Marinicella marina]
MSVKPKHIVIIGAGLVGSMHAIFLARRGYQVSVYEQLPDIRKEAISAGRSINLALANRGIDALDRLGLMDHVNKLLIPMQGRMLHDEAGALKFQSYGQKPEEVIYSVSRAGLVSILRDAAEATGAVEFFFKHECLNINFDADEITVKDQITDQTQTVKYDYLIGADGGGSQVRASMKDAGETTFSAELLDHSYKELTIPASDDGGFQIEKEALHIWPRDDYMVIGLPNPDGTFTLTLFMPNEGPVSFASINDKASLNRLFDEQFADVKALIPELETDYFNNPTGYLGTIRCADWQYKNVVLSGDSAHAIVPFHGQGMNAGFEDCVAMENALERHADNWQLAMPEFVENRIDNSNAIADMALENYIEMRADVNDPKFHLKKAIAFELENRLPDYFIPRYSMVMFHLIPYATAFARGKIQYKILDTLTEGIEEVSEVDFQRAERLVKQKLPRLSSL